MVRVICLDPATDCKAAWSGATVSIRRGFPPQPGQDSIHHREIRHTGHTLLWRTPDTAPSEPGDANLPSRLWKRQRWRRWRRRAVPHRGHLEPGGEDARRGDHRQHRAVRPDGDARTGHRCPCGRAGYERLGLLPVNRAMDGVEYRRQGGCSVVTLTKDPAEHENGPCFKGIKFPEKNRKIETARGGPILLALDALRPYDRG